MIRVSIGHPAKGFDAIGKCSILACFAHKKISWLKQPTSRSPDCVLFVGPAGWVRGGTYQNVGLAAACQSFAPTLLECK